MNNNFILDDPKLASYQHEILIEQIKEFQESLDDEHEVGLITPFNSSKPFVITEIGYHNPYLIYFYGYYNNQDSTLIQHINQISLLLTPVEKQPNKPARRIGFNPNE